MVRDFNIERIDVYCDVYKCKFVNNIFINNFLTFDHQKKISIISMCKPRDMYIFSFELISRELNE